MSDHFSERMKKEAEARKATNMTLRDYFAIHVPYEALHGLQTGDSYDDEAKERYLFADAMIKARNET